MDKYSKQMKNKLYIEERDRLPLTEGRYLVKSYGEWFSASYLDQFSFHEEMLDCNGVTHWLEELPTVSDNPNLNQPRPQLKLGL